MLSRKRLSPPSILAGDLVPFYGGKRAISLQGDRILDEMDRAVRISELQPAGMPAAEGVSLRPVPPVCRAQRRGRSGGDGDAGIGRDGTGAVGAVAVRPRVMSVELRDIFANHERVAGAVGNAGDFEVAIADV